MQKDGQMHENWMKLMGTPRQAVFFCVTRAETAELKSYPKWATHIKRKSNDPLLRRVGSRCAGRFWKPPYVMLPSWHRMGVGEEFVRKKPTGHLCSKQTVGLAKWRSQEVT